MSFSPNLTPWSGILVRVVRCGIGRNGRSGKSSHSNELIGACICSNVDLQVSVHGSGHCCGYMINGSIAMVVL